MVSKKAFLLALFAMVGCGVACAAPGNGESTVGAAFGLGIDDDESAAPGAEVSRASSSRVAPPERCKGARCRLGGVDPWAPEELTKRDPSADVIVGPDGLKNPACFPANPPFASLEESQTDTAFRYTAGDTGRVCTGLLITHSSKALVPTACRSQVKGKRGTATFDVYHSNTLCAPQGPVDAGDSYPATLEGLTVDNALGLMVVQLGPNASGDTAFDNHFSVRFNGASKWALSEGLNATDELLYGGMQSQAILIDDACHRVDPFSGGIGTTDCDSEVNTTPERGLGGFIVYDFNGCVVGAGGCAPGTGPQSQGSFPGRFVALHYLPSVTSPENQAVSLARLTDPTTGILTPHLVPGDFTP
jgi:hypothetical protein